MAYRCTAVYGWTAFLSDEKQTQGNGEWSTVAYHTVQPPPSSEGVRTRPEVEDKEDIDSHGK